MTVFQILLFVMFCAILALQIRILYNRRTHHERMAEEAYELNEELISEALDYIHSRPGENLRSAAVGLVSRAGYIWRKRYLRSHGVPVSLEREVYQRLFCIDPDSIN